jgi:hypothetical protein
MALQNVVVMKYFPGIMPANDNLLENDQNDWLLPCLRFKLPFSTLTTSILPISCILIILMFLYFSGIYKVAS